MIEITETTETLIKADKENFALYAPVGEDDRILFEERYWASSPRTAADIELCGVGAFSFDSCDEDCLQEPTHYTELDIPETATEFRAQESMESFDLHTNGLLNNGASPEEAMRFAMASLTGLPSTFFGSPPELSPAEKKRLNEFWDGLSKQNTVETWNRWRAEAEAERESKMIKEGTIETWNRWLAEAEAEKDSKQK